jgi:hypothetical protein
MRKGPSRLHCDNKSTLNTANNPIQHDRTKHIVIDHFFIKEKLEGNIIVLSYVTSGKQVANYLTKGLGLKEGELVCNKMMMIDIYHLF